MNDNLFALLITVLLGGTLLVKAVLRHLRLRGAEPKPICGCEHHLAFHTPEGICKGQTQRWLGTNNRGISQYEITNCTCQQYVGHVPAISPQIMRELSTPSRHYLDGLPHGKDGDAADPSTEPFSQDK